MEVMVGEDIAAVARHLSDTARIAATGFGDGWRAGPDLPDLVLDALDELRSSGLIERQFGDMHKPTHSQGGDTLTVKLSACWHFRLTDLGEQVRADLTGLSADQTTARR